MDIVIDNLYKRFGANEVFKGLSLTIADSDQPDVHDLRVGDG